MHACVCALVSALVGNAIDTEVNLNVLCCLRLYVLVCYKLMYLVGEGYRFVCRFVLSCNILEGA